MTGLAGRWIGFHILAFGLASLLEGCIWSAVATVGDVHAFNSSVIGNLLSYGLLAVLVAGAQTTVLIGAAFPVTGLRWFLATTVGLVVGLGVSVLSWEPSFKIVVRPFLKSPDTVRLAAFYSAWGIVFFTQGSVLALAQGILLMLRTSRSQALIWMGSVLGAWVVGRAVPYAVSQWTLSVEELSSATLSLKTALIGLGSAVASGAVFGASMLPALRRLLVRPPPS